MRASYNSYLQCEKSIPVDKMQELHEHILFEMGNDEDASEIYKELIGSAARYLDYRAKWHSYSHEKKIEMDAGRTACHNVMIGWFNALARALRRQGKQAIWRDELGDEENLYNRKKIGDFGCYLAFVEALNAR